MRRESKSLRRAVLEYCRSRHNSDEGDSIIITSLLLLPVMFFIIISAIDMGLYFNSQAVIERSAQDAARTIVLYGGAGTSGQHSALESQYGTDVTSSQLSQLSSDVGFAVNNSVEHALVNDLLGAKTALAELENVNCSPGSLNRVGDVAYCDVQWSYDGLPVSVWGMMVSNTESQLSTGNAQSQTTHTEVRLENRA